MRFSTEEIKRGGVELDNCHNLLQYWSERSACAARAVLQTGCVANVVATKFVVFSSLSPFFSLLSALLLFCQKGLS